MEISSLKMELGMKVITKYELFLFRCYKKDMSRKRWNHFDFINKGRQNFPEIKLFDFIHDFENKGIFFEIHNESTNKIITSFDRINWQKQLTKFQEIGKPFYVRFYRPTNFVDVDTDIILNDDFNQIWRNEIW